MRECSTYHGMGLKSVDFFCHGLHGIPREGLTLIFASVFGNNARIFFGPGNALFKTYITHNGNDHLIAVISAFYEFDNLLFGK